MKMPKVDIKNQQNANIKGTNINLDGKIPDSNIQGSDEEIIFSGIIKGTKKIDIPKIKGDVKIDGGLKGPELNLQNTESKIPDVGMNLKRKELDINKNIKDVQINVPEVEINSKDINLKGKNIKPHNISLEGNLPNVDINQKFPNIRIEGNIQNSELNAEFPNLDIDTNKMRADLNVNKSNINIEDNIPSIEVNGNIPKLGLDTNIQDINIKNNINIPSGGINIGEKNTNINFNSPKIELPSGNFNFEENIKDKNINMPKVNASIEKPELKDIKLETNLPEIDINKKDINLNSKKIKLEGELPEINIPERNIHLNEDIKKKDLKIPDLNINANNKEYYVTGLIPGADFNNINIKGPRRMINSVNMNPPDISIKESKIKLDQQDYNIKGSRRLEFGKQLFEDVKGSRIMYNTQINSEFKNSKNMEEININSPKIKIAPRNLNLKAKVPEINNKIEEEILLSGVIKGDKSYNKNIKVNASIPKEEIKLKIDEPKINNKEEIITGIIPSKKEVNLEAKKYNLLDNQNIDIKFGKNEVINSLNNLNTNTEINVPKLTVETENNQQGMNIGIPSLEVNLESKEKEENNNLFKVNINTNLENPLGSLEGNNSKIGQENKVYAKKNGIGLPKIGNKNMEFKASKIDVGGKLDVNNIDITNQKSANVGINGAKIGDRIEE